MKDLSELILRLLGDQTGSLGLAARFVEPLREKTDQERRQHKDDELDERVGRDDLQRVNWILEVVVDGDDRQGDREESRAPPRDTGG